MADPLPSEIALAFLPEYNEAFGWYRQLRRLDQPRHMWLLRTAIVVAYVSVSVIVAIVSAALSSALHLELTGVNFVVAFIILFLPALYLLRRVHAAINTRLRKNYLARFSPPVLQNVQAAPDGLSFVTQETSFRSSWAAIYRIFPLDGCVCLGIDTLTWCIPDRAFPSAEARDQFIRFVLGHVSDAARAKSFETGKLAAYR